MYQWEKLFKIPRGHKFFIDHSTGGIAIADDSGGTPEATEDGVLWIDFTRSWSIQSGGSGNFGWIPLRSGSQQTSTTEPLIEMLQLAAHWEQPVNVGEMACVIQTPDRAALERRFGPPPAVLLERAES